MDTSGVVVLAETGELWSDFAPYVPSITDAGVVYFQSELASGGHAIGEVSGSEPARVVVRSSGRYPHFVSHPDSGGGEPCFYAKAADGAGALLMGSSLTVVSTENVGPLGPTMNSRGEIAFRASFEGREAIHLFTDGGVLTIGSAGEEFLGFHGLPVVNELGEVCFRADLKAGGRGIFRWGEGGLLTTVAEGPDLARFPFLDDAGRVAYVKPEEGVFLWDAGETTLLRSREGFESLRGALLWDGGYVFFGTPTGGSLGVYSGDSRLFGLGDTFEGTTVSDLALNAVSINRSGGLVARLALEDGRQLVVRYQL